MHFVIVDLNRAVYRVTRFLNSLVVVNKDSVLPPNFYLNTFFYTFGKNKSTSFFVSKQTFQPWYYRSIPHNLSRNPLPGWGVAIALNITRVILSDLVPQCSAYRTFIHILILLIAVEDAVINACMYVSSAHLILEGR